MPIVGVEAMSIEAEAAQQLWRQSWFCCRSETVSSRIFSIDCSLLRSIAGAQKSFRDLRSTIRRGKQRQAVPRRRKGRQCEGSDSLITHPRGLPCPIERAGFQIYEELLSLPARRAVQGEVVRST